VLPRARLANFLGLQQYLEDVKQTYFDNGSLASKIMACWTGYLMSVFSNLKMHQNRWFEKA
jgi:hypothetical protein